MISIQQVIKKALNQNKGDMFEIKNLFDSSDWEKETKQHRRDLGTQFAKYAKGSKDFELICRKGNNHKVYERL